MTVPAAAEALSISQQFVRRLLARQTLHGEQQADRAWRVLRRVRERAAQGHQVSALEQGEPPMTVGQYAFRADPGTTVTVYTEVAGHIELVRSSPTRAATRRVPTLDHG